MPRSSSAKHVQRYRDRMRRAGLRLVQLWVPDSRKPGFAEECRRQSRLAARDRELEGEVLDWVESAHDDEGWTP